MSNETQDGIPRVVDFCELLAELDHGNVAERLSQDLLKVVEATNKTGKQGTLTVTFKVTKQNGMALIMAETNRKVPEHGLNASMYYFGKDGSLVREDPRQLSLRTLPDPKPMDAPALSIIPNGGEK